MTTLVLTPVDIRTIVNRVGTHRVMDDLIERLTAAFAAYDTQQTVVPTRAGFSYTRPQPGLIEWMPVFERGARVTLKMVGYHPHNPQLHELPSVLSTITEYDATDGRLLSLIDGVFLTALRTGAASAVASKLLAHTGSRTLGLLGCGAQAISQAHALSRVFDLTQVMYYDSDAATQASYPARVASLVPAHCELRPASIEEIVTGVDVLCTQTSIGIGKGPLFNELAPAAHLHINAVGSDFPGKTELPVNLLQQALVCPDFAAQATGEGECQQLLADQVGPPITTVARHPKAYWSARNALTVFDSTGFALEDQVVTRLFFDYASELALGTLLQIETNTDDPKNPYQFLQQDAAQDIVRAVDAS